MRLKIALLTAGMIAVQVAGAACLMAKPPPGVDLNGSLHQWFERQVNVYGTSCCKVADGHIISDDEWRISKKGYEVQIHNIWYPVRPGEMRNPVVGGPNPTGHAIVWYTVTYDGSPIIWCFSPGFEG